MKLNWKHIWVLAGCLAIGVYCFEPEGPKIYGAEPLDPPADYGAVWSAMEKCVGALRPMSEVRWEVADSIVMESGEDPEGGWIPPNRIIIVRRSLMNKYAVSHEIIHHLMGLRGDEHPSPPFRHCEFFAPMIRK